MTTKIISKLAPKNSGAFPTHSDIHGEGGFQVRADTTDRNSIPVLNRKEGMCVKLVSDNKIYTLTGGITNSNWVEYLSKGSVSFDSGSTSENIRTNRSTSQSPIDNSKNGIINLGSKTGGGSTGATGDYTTISGGENNTASSTYSTVSGGIDNTASGLESTISGGSNNTASGNFSTVSGGNSNTASGDSCTVIGGANNISVGNNSVAMGFRSKPEKQAQFAQSGGNQSSDDGGGNQFTRVIYYCVSSSNATVDFVDGLGTTSYSLENNRNYGLRVSVIASQADGYQPEYKTFDLLISVNNTGVVAVADTTASPAATPLVPTVSVGAGVYMVGYTTSTNIFNLNFKGTAAVDVRATATIEATELLFA